jgi:hypothetical protein
MYPKNMTNQAEQIFNIAIKSLPESTTSLIDVLSALLTPIIALLAIYIAYQQYKISEHRLRHEIYEKRVKIYMAVNKFISQITANGQTNFTNCHEFYSEASEAAFLFDSSIMEYIDQLYGKAIVLIELQEKLYPSDESQGLEVGEERSNVASQKAVLFKWFAKQLTESKELFTKKIGIKLT